MVGRQLGWVDGWDDDGQQEASAALGQHWVYDGPNLIKPLPMTVLNSFAPKSPNDGMTLALWLMAPNTNKCISATADPARCLNFTVSKYPNLAKSGYLSARWVPYNTTGANRITKLSQPITRVSKTSPGTALRPGDRCQTLELASLRAAPGRFQSSTSAPSTLLGPNGLLKPSCCLSIFSISNP